MRTFYTLLLLCSFSEYASAEIIDDIALKPGVNGEVDAVVKFTVPVQYVRHFPQKESPYLAIYFNILNETPRNEWQDYESHRAPPSDLIIGFTVSTRDLNTGPKIEVLFNRAADFTVTPGNNGRSIVLHIKPISTTQKIALPAQLGGKDGLPPFPVITPVAAPANTAENLTLAEQVQRANSQAAVQMMKGRDALFAGSMFSAIEAFNNVLRLPPNQYSPDAQLWIGIAREKSGQPAKAILEFDSYLKLYPDGSSAAWVKNRLARLKAVTPGTAQAAPVKAPSMEFQTMQYGSYSMYYYHGASHTDTISTVGNVQTPSSLTLTDQSSIINNVSLTSRSYNNEYDNRLVFQDFYAANFLKGQKSRNRLNAAFFEVKNRVENFSARIGRQSAYGGGVLGRFDGISVGAGFSQDARANLVAGQLSDLTLGPRPVFLGAGLDFGIHDPTGGSLYVINQTVGGITDRKAVGGNLRYFEQRKTALAMVDFDTQFKAMNMLTLQGTLNSESGADYNFLFDRRRSPSFSIRSAVNGTTTSVNTLLQNGWTQTDLLLLAKQRTAMSTMAQVGVTDHLDQQWQLGVDFMVSNTSGMPASGTLNPDGTTGLEGFVAASAATGNTWTISERLLGNNVISNHDTTMFNLSFTKSHLLQGKSVLFNSHSYLQEHLALDTTLRMYWQTDYLGGKQNISSPMLKLGYQVKDHLTLETEGGLELTKSSPPGGLQSSKTTRRYFSLGFRWDF